MTASELPRKFLNPRNDVAFHRTFGTEKYKHVLIGFINDVLEFEGDSRIIDVTFLSPNQNPDIISKKTSVVDVLCKDSNDIQYIVEMQVASEKGFEKRALHYASKAYASQLDKGDDRYWNLKKVIFIAITNYVVFPKKIHYKSDHVILDKNTHENDIKDISFTFIELPKYTKGKSEKVSNRIEHWCNYFKYADDTTEQEVSAISDPVVKEAYEAINQFNWTEEELKSYEAELKRDRDLIAGMAAAEDRGIEIGRTEGRIEVAKMLLKCGDTITKIMSVTGLSKEQIEEIK